MNTLVMLVMIGAVELWCYRQVLLVGAGLGLLVRYLWQRRALVGEGRRPRLAW